MSNSAQVHFVDLDIEDRKRAIAYQIWLNEGKPEGRAKAHWEMACEIVARGEMTRLSPLGKLPKQESVKEPDWLKHGTSSSVTVQQQAPSASAEETQIEIEDIRRRIVGRSTAQ